MTKKSSVAMLVACLAYFQRTGDHDKYPQYWEPMQETFELALIEFWKDVHKDGVSRTGFLESSIDMVAMFVDKDAVQAIEGCIARKEDIPLHHIKTVIESKLGAVLYEIEGYNVEWARIVRRQHTLL